MQETENSIKQGIAAAFKKQFEFDLPVSAIDLQPTKKEFEGNLTFVVFPFVKQARVAPEKLAQSIGEYLVNELKEVERFNVVKGFLNLQISDKVWVTILAGIFDDFQFGNADPIGEKVMVEFSSPNTNKPLHLGHLRNNFLGESVSRILKAAGYDVLKTNLINDRGIHICKSMLAYQMFGQNETPASTGMKGDHFVGKYYVRFDQEYKKEVSRLTANGVEEEQAKKTSSLILAAQNLLKKWEEKDEETVALWRRMNGWVYDGFGHSYQTMGITFDKVYYESDTYLLGKDIVNEGLEKGVFFQKEDGSVWVDLTDEGMDQKLVQRSDGTSVYITQDMGTCDYKYQDFPFQKSVYVVGNEQDYHFKVLFSIMSKLGRNYAPGLYHLSYGMVDLPSGKMKSREGTVVDADDIMQEMFDKAQERTLELGKIEGMDENEARSLFSMLGLGALKYFLLKVDPRKRMLFNPDESIEFQGNTGPFIQYTHARIAAILRRAKQLEKVPGVHASIQHLHEREVAVASILSRYPQIIKEAAREYSPALIAQYVYDLAKEYNGFYQEVSIFNESDSHALEFRLALSQATAQTIKSAMNLLGITVPDRM